MDDKNINKLSDDDLDDVTGGAFIIDNLPYLKKKKIAKDKTPVNPDPSIQTVRYNPNENIKSC